MNSWETECTLPFEGWRHLRVRKLCADVRCIAPDGVVSGVVSALINSGDG
ncbi:MAG: hypothetical protein U9R72_12470 [Chloroflexota bacterium]|nr:hypothetical protein [Chloroflexota bacterium]